MYETQAKTAGSPPIHQYQVYIRFKRINTVRSSDEQLAAIANTIETYFNQRSVRAITSNRAVRTHEPQVTRMLLFQLKRPCYAYASYSAPFGQQSALVYSYDG
jgi:hypothetical protein